MNDIIDGRVIQIIDDDTFIMKVSNFSSNYDNKYNTQETIHIESIEVPKWYQPVGREVTESLTKRLLDKYIYCSVSTRDNFGRLVSKIIRIYQ